MAQLKTKHKGKNHIVIKSKINYKLSKKQLAYNDPNNIILRENIKTLIDRVVSWDYEFAIKCKIPRSRLSNVINGRYTPTVQIIFKIITAYPNLNLNWLFTNKGNMWYKEVSGTKAVQKRTGKA